MATITTKETRDFDWANPGVLKVGDAMQEPNARMITWRLAKRAARDFLRVSFMNSAIVTATKAYKPFTVVRVYGRY